MIRLAHAKLIKSDLSRNLACCCGAGGVVLASNRRQAVSVIIRRLQKIASTASSLLITSCPNCEFTFEIVGHTPNVDLDVLDVIDLV